MRTVKGAPGRRRLASGSSLWEPGEGSGGLGSSARSIEQDPLLSHTEIATDRTRGWVGYRLSRHPWGPWLVSGHTVDLVFVYAPGWEAFGGTSRRWTRQQV